MQESLYTLLQNKPVDLQNAKTQIGKLTESGLDAIISIACDFNVSYVTLIQRAKICGNPSTFETFVASDAKQTTIITEEDATTLVKIVDRIDNLFKTYGQTLFNCKPSTGADIHNIGLCILPKIIVYKMQHCKSACQDQLKELLNSIVPHSANQYENAIALLKSQDLNTDNTLDALIMYINSRNCTSVDADRQMSTEEDATTDLDIEHIQLAFTPPRKIRVKYDELCNVLESKLKYANNVCTTTINGLNQQIAGLNTTIDGLNKTNGELKKENDDSTNAINELKKGNTDLTNAINELKKENDDLNKTNADSTNAINDLKNENADSTNAINELKKGNTDSTNAINELKKENDDLNKTNADSTNAINDLKNENADSTNAINELKKGNTDLTNTINELKKGNTDLTNTINELKKENADSTNAINDLKKENADSTNAINELKKGNTDLTNTIGDLRKTIGELNKENADSTNAINELKKGNADLTNTIGDLRKTIGELNNEIVVLKAEIAASNKKAADSNKENYVLKAEIATSKKEIDVLKAEIDVLKKKNEELAMKDAKIVDQPKIDVFNCIFRPEAGKNCKKLPQLIFEAMIGYPPKAHHVAVMEKGYGGSLSTQLNKIMEKYIDLVTNAAKAIPTAESPNPRQVTRVKNKKLT
jgi:chromosome segregation ATPase